MINPRDIRAEHLANEVSSELHLFVGRKKKYTKADLSRLTGLSDNTVNVLMKPTSGMRFDTAYKLLCVPYLGQPLLDRLIAPLGVASHNIMEGQGCYRKIHTSLAEAVTELCQALEDDNIDHLEEPEIIAKLKDVRMRIDRALGPNSVLKFRKP